jgi:hypothetical protein
MICIVMNATAINAVHHPATAEERTLFSKMWFMATPSYFNFAEPDNPSHGFSLGIQQGKFCFWDE